MIALRWVGVGLLIAATTLAADTGQTWLVPGLVVIVAAISYLGGVLDNRSALRRDFRR